MREPQPQPEPQPETETEREREREREPETETETETVLSGGFVNDVVRVGATVRRTPPARPDFVHGLLGHLERRGWSGAPRYLGVDGQGREILGHIDGRAAWQPGDRRKACTDAALVRVAELLREFHDLTAGTPLAGAHEVVCHNDLAPKNTVYAVDGGDWRPLAFIDWDLAAPGERIHDVAHVCWQYLDLGPAVTDVPEAARRIALIREAYGIAGQGRIVDSVLWWQDRCARGIEAAAGRGDPAMIRIRESGVVEEVRAAHRWVSDHRPELAGSSGAAAP
ncbi:phosphotransferase [Streptomyces sp. NBC_00876]|uniref:phosphotransferase n=1 Tax=Streptomyces sp. NBC_00876 TaxID=2975853 RepID=UPI003869395E|nr:phosphotransferase [Streptomyces sp. NBC_00876]